MTNYQGLPTNLTSTSLRNDATWPAHTVINTLDKGVRQLTQGRASLADFGAVMDGVADDTAAVSSWLDYCNTNNVTGFIPPNKRVLSGQINKGYRIRIDGNNSTIVMKSGISGQGPMWRFTGSETGSVLVSSNVAAGATQITLAAGWASTLGTVGSGTVLMIGKDVPWTTDLTTGRPGEKVGQSVQVSSVSGDVVTLREAIVLPYTTADAAKVWKFNTIDDVIFNNLNFEGIYSGIVRVIDIAYGKDVEFNNCKVAGNGSMGVRLLHCYHFDVDLEAYDMADDTPNQKYGYGVNAAGACSHGRINVRGARARHLVTTDGIQGYGGVNQLIISGYGSQCTAEAFDTHASGTNVTFQGIIAVDNPGGGMQARSTRTTILGCHLADNPHHVKIGWDATDVKVIGNYFGPTQRYAAGGTYACCFRMEPMENTQFAHHMVFSGNTFEGIRDAIMRMGGGGNHPHNYIIDFIGNDVISFGIDNASGDQAIIRGYSGTKPVGVTDTNNYGINVIGNKIRSTATAPHILYGSGCFVGTAIIAFNVIGTNVTKAQSGTGATVTDTNNIGGI